MSLEKQITRRRIHHTIQQNQRQIDGPMNETTQPTIINEANATWI